MNRGRALVLTTRLPWPLDDGGHIATYQTLWAIAREYETTLLSFDRATSISRPVPRELTELGIDVVRVQHRPPILPIAVLRGLLGRWPYTLARYWSGEFNATLQRLVAARRPAFALVNALHLTPYIEALGDVPVVLRAHNLEHLWLERYARRLRNPLARAYALDQARRIRVVEAERCARCRMVLAIREEEATALRSLAPATRIETLPLGIRMDRYRPRTPSAAPVVALIGSWEWAPNVDGAREFLSRGWPRVRERFPEARLRLVGKGISSDFAATAAAAGAEIVGYVEDVTLEFARASALVVPLWMGSGVRVKIVEALAARLPVVSTSIGAEGLGLVGGEHLALADTPEDLGDALLVLLREPDRALAMGESGHRHVRERFSLETVGRRTLELCASIAQGGQGRA